MSPHPLLAEGWPQGGTPLAPDLHSPYFLPVTEEILVEITRRIVEALHPEKIILFGSYAYGTPHVDSDVDLLVIMDSNKQPAERAVDVGLLIWPRPFPMDILVKTPEEMALASNKWLEESIQNGRILFSQPGA